MEWDKFRMAQRFLQQANAIHPEDEYEEGKRVDALARQDVYYDCYMSSFSREDLFKRLNAVILGDITMPEDEVTDETRYRSTYMKEARAILDSLEPGTR